MSISTEEKDRYLSETAIVLAREGFQTGKTDTGKLRVLLDGAPLCEVTENGGITYRNAGWSSEQTRSPLRHMGLGLWAHRSMSWALFHGELCRSQTGLCYPLRADSKGTAFHPRADDRDLALLCGLCRRRFL